MDKEIGDIGTNAGKVWHALNEVKLISLQELSRMIGLSFEETSLAVGWLARENKIYFLTDNNQLMVGLGEGDPISFSFG